VACRRRARRINFNTAQPDRRPRHDHLGRRSPGAHHACHRRARLRQDPAGRRAPGARHRAGRTRRVHRWTRSPRPGARGASRWQGHVVHLVRHARL